MLFALVRYFGHGAIFAVLAGIALGTLALRTRSIYGGVLIHIAVAWSMDLLVLSHKGQLQNLLGGF